MVLDLQEEFGSRARIYSANSSRILGLWKFLVAAYGEKHLEAELRCL